MLNYQEDELLALAERAWRLHLVTIGDSQITNLVVKPSMPVLYFGNLPEYANSRLRVVTLGINPSAEEFPVDDRLGRFPLAKSIPRISEGVSPEKDMLHVYLSSLNNYFERPPYAWFKAYDDKLRKLPASYYRSGSVAIHTDFHSPLATILSWGKLRKGGKEDLLNRMTEGGSALWKDLIALLSPHLIVTTIRGKYIREIIEKFAPSECLQEYAWKKGFGCEKIVVNKEETYLVKVNCLPGGQPSPRSLDKAFTWLKPKL